MLICSGAVLRLPRGGSYVSYRKCFQPSLWPTSFPKKPDGPISLRHVIWIVAGVVDDPYRQIVSKEELLDVVYALRARADVFDRMPPHAESAAGGPDHWGLD